MRSSTIIKIMFIALAAFSICNAAKANPFEDKKSFEIKIYSEIETAFYKNIIHSDLIDEFSQTIAKYLKSLGYESPLGIRPIKNNFMKFAGLIEFCYWKNKNGDRVTMFVHKAPNKKHGYLISFKIKDNKGKARYKK